MGAGAGRVHSAWRSPLTWWAGQTALQPDVVDAPLTSQLRAASSVHRCPSQDACTPRRRDRWLINHHGLENADAAPSPVCAPQFWGPQVGEVYPDHPSLHYHAGQLLDLAAYCMAAYDGGEVSAHMRPPSQTRHCMHESTNVLQCRVVRTSMLCLPAGCLLTYVCMPNSVWTCRQVAQEMFGHMGLDLCIGALENMVEPDVLVIDLGPDRYAAGQGPGWVCTAASRSESGSSSHACAGLDRLL